MTDIHRLLHQLAAQEDQLKSTQIIAPCVRNGVVQTRVAGMVYTFKAEPHDFEGWGIFQPVDRQQAALVEEAALPKITEYLQRLKAFRLRLAYALQGRTWLAYPHNEADMQQRLGMVKPVPVHLVEDGVAFEPIIARWDGTMWWFEELDRRADPWLSEQLCEQLRQITPPNLLQFKDLTAEMRSLYELVARHTPEFQPLFEQQRLQELQMEAQLQPWQEPLRRPRQGEQQRLEGALRQGGGQLREYRDRGDHYWVEWTTADGVRHTSAISKDDLTVISSGICLSGRDQEFDLQSLVGVMEGADW